MNKKYSRRQVLQWMGVTGLGAFHLPALVPVRYTTSMLERKIPSSGESLPVVGLGTWQQFDVGASAAERDPLLLVLQEMHRMGGRLIDSSPMYARSEAVIGELTAAMPAGNDFFYATKVWTRGKQEGLDQMQASLQKMRRKKMDLIQVHNLVDWRVHLPVLKSWKQEGRIRYTGITHYTESAHAELEQVIRKEKPDFVQFNYSIRRRNAEKSLLLTARDHGVAVIINEPFESGELFRLVRGKPLPSWSGEYDINSWGQFFLKFILSQEAVNCVIPGTSNPKHALDNMGAGYGRVPDPAARERMAAYIDKL